MPETVTLASLEATRSLALRLAPMIGRGEVIALVGEVGAGKTTFARALIEVLGGGADATSPTFTLVQPYPVTLADGTRTTLYHLDLYRVTHPRELEELGIAAMREEVMLIEWPERLTDATIVTLALQFTLNPDGTRRATLHRMRP